MTTALAVTGRDHLLSPSDRRTPGAHVFRPPAEEPLDVALAHTQALLERHGYLVVVHPSTLPTAYLHRLHTLRALLESDRIALLPSELPPLALGVLVRQLRQLSLCGFSPGVLGCAARLLTHYVHAGALLGSVARLDRVPVTLTAHAKSWLPGAQFAVTATPAPQLVRLGAKDEHPLSGPQFATRLTVATGGLTSDWPRQVLARDWRVSEVQEEPLPQESPAWWGTSKLIEFAAGIPELPVLHQLVASVRRDTCRWCGLEVLGDRCAFCSAGQRASGPRPEEPVPGRLSPSAHAHPAGNAADLRPAVHQGVRSP